MKRFLVVALIVVSMLIVVGPVFGNGPIHKVSVGGPDACFPDQPGCDSNYSLIAMEFADGSVKGQFTDLWSNGNGFHAVIDCLVVVGNEAWLSGVITSGKTSSGYDIVGLRINTRVKDNGTSANDPPDQISGSAFRQDLNCTDMPEITLWDIPQGQVIVE